MKRQADYQRTSFATCTTRLLDRPADYVRTHCSQSWDRECVPKGDKCQNFRRARQCVALKSINLDGKVVPLLRAWAPLDNMALVTVYRDARGVLSSLIRHNYMHIAHGSSESTRHWVLHSSVGTRHQRIEQVLEYAREYAHNLCGKLSADFKGVDAWYRSHSYPLYVRINAEEFIGQDPTAETRLADEVRALLGMAPLSEARLRLSGLPLASAEELRRAVQPLHVSRSRRCWGQIMRT